MQQLVGRYTHGDKDKRDEILQVYYHSCAIDFESLKIILDFHKVGIPEQDEGFFLGDDGTSPETKDDLVAHGAVLWTDEEHNAISRAEEMNRMSKESYRCDPRCFSVGDFKRLERSILDMSTFKSCEFFVGSWMS